MNNNKTLFDQMLAEYHMQMEKETKLHDAWMVLYEEWNADINNKDLQKAVNVAYRAFKTQECEVSQKARHVVSQLNLIIDEGGCTDDQEPQPEREPDLVSSMAMSVIRSSQRVTYAGIVINGKAYGDSDFVKAYIGKWVDIEVHPPFIQVFTDQGNPICTFTR
jgi:DNA polymerase I-like protein with 3'-5' exonuclease and polymerase domains